MLYRLFTSPYPFSRGWKTELFGIIVTFIIASLLLFIIKPFGLDRIEEDKASQFIFSILGSLVLYSIAINVLLKEYLSTKLEARWTTIKEIIWLSMYLFGVACLIFNIAIMYAITQLQWLDVLTFIVITFVMSFIPVSFTVLLKQNWLLKNTLSRLETLPNSTDTNNSIKAEDPPSLITIKGNTNEGITLTLNDLLFIKAQQNYTEIVFIKDSKIKTMLMRSTLSNLLSQLPPTIVKCHRSYLVNLQNILSISGNAQGYQLKVFDKIVVPVSRGFIKDFDIVWKHYY